MLRLRHVNKRVLRRFYRKEDDDDSDCFDIKPYFWKRRKEDKKEMQELIKEFNGDYLVEDEEEITENEPNLNKEQFQYLKKLQDYKKNIIDGKRKINRIRTDSDGGHAKKG